MSTQSIVYSSTYWLSRTSAVDKYTTIHVALARDFAFSVNQCMMSSGGWGAYHDI